jgi:hypothetical protein
MPCNCGTKQAAKVTYKATLGDGTVKVFSSEIEAKAVARRGGSYQKQ